MDKDIEINDLTYGKRVIHKNNYKLSRRSDVIELPPAPGNEQVIDQDDSTPTEDYNPERFNVLTDAGNDE